MKLSLEEIVQEGFDLRTIKEWAEQVDVSRMTIHNWIRNGNIHYTSIRSNTYVVLTTITKDFKGKRKC
jgi:excisionase family DNA binding protein